jgi:hypothetical protein
MAAVLTPDEVLILIMQELDIINLQLIKTMLMLMSILAIVFPQVKKSHEMSQKQLDIINLQLITTMLMLRLFFKLS